MTGSALAMDGVLGLLLGENLLEWGGGLEEGTQKIRPDRRWADDGKRFQAMDVVWTAGGIII